MFGLKYGNTDNVSMLLANAIEGKLFFKNAMQ